MMVSVVMRWRHPPTTWLTQPDTMQLAGDKGEADRIADKWARAFPGEEIWIVTGQKTEYRRP